MNLPKINFVKILTGVFIFLAIFGLIQLIKDNGKVRDNSLSQNFETSPAGSYWPEGWVKWNDIFEGESVMKYGPRFSEADYVIQLSARMINLLPDGSSCVGDSESASCVVGSSEEIKNGFDKAFHFY